MGQGRSNSYQILRSSFFSFLTKMISCGFLAGDWTHWLGSYHPVLLSFQEKSVTDALAFSTAKIPAVDRINLLNLSMNNRKSVFSHPHSVTHTLLLYLVKVLLFLNLVFDMWKLRKILTLKFVMFGQSVAPTDSLLGFIESSGPH